MYPAIPATSLIWMTIALFAFSMLVFFVCFAMFVFIRWAYKRRVRHKTEEMLEKYKDEEAMRKELELREKRAAILPQLCPVKREFQWVRREPTPPKTAVAPYSPVVSRHPPNVPATVAYVDEVEDTTQAEQDSQEKPDPMRSCLSTTQPTTAEMLRRLEINFGGYPKRKKESRKDRNSKKRLAALKKESDAPKLDDKTQDSQDEEKKKGKSGKDTDDVGSKQGKGNGTKKDDSRVQDNQQKATDIVVQVAKQLDAPESTSIARRPLLFPYFTGQTPRKDSEKEVFKKLPTPPPSSNSLKSSTRNVVVAEAPKEAPKKSPAKQTTVENTANSSVRIWRDDVGESKLQRRARDLLERRRQRRDDRVEATQMDETETTPKKKFVATLTSASANNISNDGDND